LISLPVSGIGDSDTLAGSMQGSGQLSNGSVSAVAAFHGGLWNVAVPGYTSNISLQPSDGVFVLSNSKGAWTPSGALYSGTSTLNFGTGWNLVSAAWPNPGVMTDSLFNQVEAENHACHADSFTNGACDPTVTAIDTYGPTYDKATGTINGWGQYETWNPAAPDSSGNATWPEPYGNQVPFTNGMWVKADHPLSWTPEGTQCQTIATGMCQ
jgi:hypothetical protein